MFKTVMREKRTELKSSINRLKVGLDRLIDANIEVEKMQVTLRKL
jgi:dynein heavy chain, axonemal